MSKSRLADILGLEEDEEYTVKGDNDIVYRIHKGERQYQDPLGRWCYVCSDNSLTALINDPSLIRRKPRFSDEEMTFLRLLHKYGKVSVLMTDEHGRGDWGSLFDVGSMVAKNILKPNEIVDLDEMFGGDA